MPILPWRTDADGYIFSNSWVFDPTERAALTALIAPAVAGVLPAIFAIDPLIPADPALVATLTIAAAAYTTLGPLPKFGMCGGMAWSSLDHWIAKVPLPCGAMQTGQPLRTTAVQNSVRSMIWQRLLDSLTKGGALNMTIEWSLILNQLPQPLGGGAPALVSRTATEWAKVKARIDSGVPCPIGLIYGNRNVWDQHQILVYGYDDNGHGGRLYVYDSNFPHAFGATGHLDPGSDIVSFDLSGSTLNATSPSDFGDVLAGFFCTTYGPMPPPAGLAPNFGEFLSWINDPRSWTIAYGALLPAASAAELTAIGGNAAGVMATGAPAPFTVIRPRDNALLREHSAAPVFLYQGGAPFWVPDPTQLTHFGGWGAVRVVPDGTLNAFLGAPADGTLLREFSSQKIFKITAGVPAPAGAVAVADVRIVPDGAIAALLLDHISFSVPRITIGRTATGTVFLKSAWTDSDLTVTLLCSPTGFATVPASVTIPKGSQSATFTITTLSVTLPSSPMPIVINATLGNNTIVAPIPLQIPRIVSLSVTPSPITAGATGTGTITIEVPYAADLVIALQSFTPTFASVPATVTIPKGAVSAQFTVTAPASAAAFATLTVTIQASVLDTSLMGTVQVKSSVILGTLKTLTLSPASVHPGSSVTGTVTLESAVGTLTRVGLSAMAPGAGLGTTSPYISSIPTEVDIAAGQVQGTFKIQTKTGSTGTHLVQVMATAVAVKYASLTIA